jgi:hypothetical protein
MIDNIMSNEFHGTVDAQSEVLLCGCQCTCWCTPYNQQSVGGYSMMDWSMFFEY